MYGSIPLQKNNITMKMNTSKRGSSIASGVINLGNTIVGAGMLGLPGAFGGTGWLSGIIILLLSATFSAHGLVLLSKSACITGIPSSFYSVAMASVPRYTILIDLAVALKCFGVATGYLITISESLVNALDHILLPAGDTAANNDDSWIVSLLLSRHFWVVGSLLLVLPFSFYKTLDELKKASAVALVFVFMLVITIIAYANDHADPCESSDDSCRGDVEAYTNIGMTISKIPIFVFSFTCHQNIFPIVNEIELLSQKRLNIVICCSISLALITFATVALEGYKTYGSLVRGDILINYPKTKQISVLRICIAFMLALHYPLQLDPSRRCITSLVKVILKWRTTQTHKQSTEGEIEMEQEEEVPPIGGVIHDDSSYYQMSQNNIKQQQKQQDEEIDTIGDDRLFNVITVSFLISSFVLAMIIDDLGVILALVGATGSTLVSYVLPGLIYVKVYPHNDLSKMMAYIQLLLGIMIIPLALYFIVTNQRN